MPGRSEAFRHGELPPPAPTARAHRARRSRPRSRGGWCRLSDPSSSAMIAPLTRAAAPLPRAAARSCPTRLARDNSPRVSGLDPLEHRERGVIRAAPPCKPGQRRPGSRAHCACGAAAATSTITAATDGRVVDCGSRSSRPRATASGVAPAGVAPSHSRPGPICSSPSRSRTRAARFRRAGVCTVTGCVVLEGAESSRPAMMRSRTSIGGRGLEPSGGTVTTMPRLQRLGRDPAEVDRGACHPAARTRELLPCGSASPRTRAAHALPARSRHRVADVGGVRPPACPSPRCRSRLIVKTRSTGSRGRWPMSAFRRERRPTRLSSSAHRSSSPVAGDRRTAHDEARLRRAGGRGAARTTSALDRASSQSSVRQVALGERHHSRARTWSRSRIAKCSRVWGITPSSAATTSSATSIPPTPASMFLMNRSCPGTSTMLTSRPLGSVSHANPRVDRQPARLLLGAGGRGRCRSAPGPARLLPWSTWPAVPMTYISASGYQWGGLACLRRGPGGVVASPPCRPMRRASASCSDRPLPAARDHPQPSGVALQRLVAIETAAGRAPDSAPAAFRAIEPQTGRRRRRCDGSTSPVPPRGCSRRADRRSAGADRAFIDADTVMSPAFATWWRGRRPAGCSAPTDLVARGELDGAHSASCAPHRAITPQASRAMGFCLINNVAVAAAHRARGGPGGARGDRRFRRAPRQRNPGDLLPPRRALLYLSTHQFPALPRHGRFAPRTGGRADG